MSRKRIVIIGGGGAYAMGLTEGVIDFGRDQLEDATIVLFDVSDRNLPFVQAYGERVARQLGVNVHVESTTDRRRAFDGADYLVSQFGVGGHEMQELDERVPQRFGLQGNETVGIGGMFRGLRVVEILRGMLADADELCPDAWMVNYTNPTQMVADAVGRLSKVRIISVCDGWVDTVEDLALVLDVAPERVHIEPAGTNHAIWVMRFTVDGVDGYPLLRERLARTTRDELRARFERVPDVIEYRDGSHVPSRAVYKQFLYQFHYRLNFQLDLFELYGLFPGPHYYPNYFFDQDAQIEAQRGPDYVTMAAYYEAVSVPGAFKDLDGRVQRTVSDLRNRRPGKRGIASDFGIEIVAAIENDLGKRFVVNVRNDGAIANLPDDAIVEVPAIVGRTGARATSMGALPRSIMGTQYALAIANGLTVDAAISGRRDDLLRAILAHPLVNSLDAAERCMDELLTLQRAWLPQFHASVSVS